MLKKSDLTLEKQGMQNSMDRFTIDHMSSHRALASADVLWLRCSWRRSRAVSSRPATPDKRALIQFDGAFMATLLTP